MATEASLAQKRKRDREYRRRWRRENAERERATRRRYYDRHKTEIAAHNLEVRAMKRQHAVARRDVQRAIASGLLVRGECEFAPDCFGAIEAHHDDYSKPLEVRWLCKSHHMRLHAREPAS